MPSNVNNKISQLNPLEIECLKSLGLILLIGSIQTNDYDESLESDAESVNNSINDNAQVVCIKPNQVPFPGQKPTIPKLEVNYVLDALWAIN